MKQAKSSRKRRLWIGLLLLGILGLSISAVMFARWTDVRTVTVLEARGEFEQALERCGDPRPYLHRELGGAFVVDRTLEGQSFKPLRTLHLVFWDAADLRIVLMNLPMWFVRVKSTQSINLGTYTSILARDWAHLELSVTVKDLQARGPGLVMDTELEGQGRLLLWTE